MKRFLSLYYRDLLSLATAVSTAVGLLVIGWQAAARQTTVDLRLSGCEERAQAIETKLEKSVDRLEGKIDKLIDLHVQP
jgi:hypothetical protein